MESNQNYAYPGGRVDTWKKKEVLLFTAYLGIEVVPGLYHAGHLNSNRVLTAFLASKTEVEIWSDRIFWNVRVRS